MNRFTLLFFLWLAGQTTTAQNIFWVNPNPCTNKQFCFNPGACNQATIMMTEPAVTPCSNQNINYSYKIDLNNDGSTDIMEQNDTLFGTFNKGTHRVTWKATDGCAQLITCSYLFTIKDCQPPSLLCFNGLTQGIDLPECEATFPAKQFIINYSDNCTPTNQIEVAIREAGTGTGFPTNDSITFTKCQQGIRFVEVWVRDGNGLMNSCNNYVLVQPGTGQCICDNDGDIHLSGCVRTVSNKKLSNYRLKATAQSTGGLPMPVTKSINKIVTDSCFANTIAALPYPGNYQVIVRGERNSNTINGVSTFDLVLMSKHILGVEQFTSMYQLLAADVNASNTVTTFDIVETRKIVLGVYDSFPAVPSWRFIRPLSNPANLNFPFASVKDTFQLNFSNLSTDLQFSGLDFIALKMGDVNLSVDPFGGPAEDRMPLILTAADKMLLPGQEIDIPIYFNQSAALNGWQIGLRTDPDYVQIKDADGIAPENLFISDGTFRALWFDANRQLFDQASPFITLKVKVLKPILLSKALIMDTQALVSEAYDAGNNRRSLQLQIGRSTLSPDAAFLPPHPNPTSGATTFDFTLQTPTPVQLTIYNLTGQQVYTLSTTLETGAPSIEIPETVLSESGIFIWQLNLAGQMATGKICRQ